MMEIIGKPVQVRYGPATVISRAMGRHHCLDKRWEGVDKPQADSQETCLKSEPRPFAERRRLCTVVYLQSRIPTVFLT